jgi:GcrA cell cycle regulator
VKWTDEMDAVLRRCRLSGLSCSQTSDVLRAEIGVRVSRNSVIGRSNRLNLPHVDGGQTKARAASFARKKSRMTAPKIQPRAGVKVSPVKLETAPIPETLPDDIPTKTFDELEWNDGCCRWRVDKSYKNRPYGFCAKEALPGLTFCEGHARRAYANWPEIRHKYVKPVEAREKEAV